MLNRKYEVESFKVTLDNLKKSINLTEITDDLNTRLETILYGDEDSGRRTKINSIIPLYEQGEIEQLLVFFEKEEQIGIIFNIDEDTYFYPKEYLNIFKINNEIALNKKVYMIKNVIFDLDNSEPDHILLKVNLEEKK